MIWSFKNILMQWRMISKKVADIFTTWNIDDELSGDKKTVLWLLRSFFTAPILSIIDNQNSNEKKSVDKSLISIQDVTASDITDKNGTIKQLALLYISNAGFPIVFHLASAHHAYACKMFNHDFILSHKVSIYLYTTKKAAFRGDVDFFPSSDEFESFISLLL